jgi:hypothetical protein
MDKQLASILPQFLQRMTLIGNEVAAFTALATASSGIANGSLVVVAATPQANAG